MLQDANAERNQLGKENEELGKYVKELEDTNKALREKADASYTFHQMFSRFIRKHKELEGNYRKLLEDYLKVSESAKLTKEMFFDWNETDRYMKWLREQHEKDKAEIAHLRNLIIDYRFALACRHIEYDHSEVFDYDPTAYEQICKYVEEIQEDIEGEQADH